ncbi:ABC transporter permease [Stackebrandtia nassauensis]|uniref:ABC-2 type transporter transmembrane domain-containing protein n=1 Tax=Stackebrandtia nassauensis (strain DSM 44728 / CIP 108903 / NRRL B-16338 / NBRC 102104 / LLR-40K-21) TaxID=446470 RepID=D3Q782_STANL|nr:ABC transporter permease [Stackebrandtia nassauensis]ADD42353.1 hypothetical protein Snas_2676 [Stackebrandtia nassauensis DSM 44728]
MSTQNPSATPTPWLKIGISILGLVALLTVILLAFALPALKSEPHDIPLAVAGPATAAEQVADQLEAKDAETFDLTVIETEDEARELIDDREVYGAIVIGPQGMTMYTASAASPAVSTMLTQMAAKMSAESGAKVPVEDVHPAADDDPNQRGLAAGALPLALAGYISAIMLALTVVGTLRQVIGLIVLTSVAAATLIAILQFWFGSIAGDYWINTAAGALGISAAAWMVLGLHAVLGKAGLGLGAATLILLGNPLSGLASAPELLPTGWSTVGQLLPPGATGTLLRSTGFFDGTGSTQAIWVLAVWVAVGVLMYAIGTTISSAKRRKAQEAPHIETEPERSPSPA